MNNFTLLYVEDDIDAQTWMKMMIEDEVKEFFQAFDGEEGLQMYKKHKPDIILTDINMPILDGLKMAKEIKSIDKNQHILIMSAFDDREILLNSINIGIDYFISKPIDMSELMQKLKEIGENLQETLNNHKQKEQEIEELYNLAHYDSLTKIYNRFFFMRQLKKYIDSKKTFSLLFIDLDDFKIINDTYGHLAGDKVLQSVCLNVNKLISKNDIFARLGGDEFALIIDEIDDKEYIDELANKLLEAISTDVYFEENVFRVSGSIGISRFPNDANSKSELLHLADVAMYKAKKLGKSAYCYV